MLFAHLFVPLQKSQSMGIFINKGNSGFRQARNSEYVDKSGLIGEVNKTLFTEQKFTCVTRCRRFGKSMAAKMLAAYYDKSCDSRSLFADLQIVENPTFEEHLNKYPVIYLDMTSFVTRYKDNSIIFYIQDELKSDLQAAYPQISPFENDDLMAYMQRISLETGEHFIFIIDEWDAICRDFGDKPEVMDDYLNLLRRMFKDVSGMEVFATVYMTGILPIKKFKTQSALNNFVEYSMVTPGPLAPFFGFTKEEVRQLAEKHRMDFDDLEKWYDGYQIGAQSSMFNPNSVMMAIRNDWCDSYWGKTGATDAMAGFINMNYGGLKDDIIRMLAGERCEVDPAGFKNDLSQINSRDDVLTVLIHLGYLGYDRREKECYVPNREVAVELVNAVRENNWTVVSDAIQKSRQLLQATIAGDADTVARLVDAAHDENTSILSYNDENSLACVLAIAYYYAHGNYVFHREYASGKGFADLVLQPRKNVDSPAIIIELKYGHSADEAIAQIKQKDYSAKVAQYTDHLLLVGINYDRDTKQHTCKIEKY